MALAPSRYELLNRIAVGGMAEVFRAKAFGAHGFEKTLAIKRILPELAKDQEFEERFIAEAKLAVGLSHANVVQVLDFGRFAGSLFIAMELVNGLDLAALLKFYSDRDERVSIPAAFQISIEIIRGLSFAHQNGVVHRDVSPSNILLSKAGEVKIADFGIAVAMQQEVSSDVGRIMGKWRYMSPEQTTGQQLGETSDLFSAAVVIHEIFSGRKLFPGVEAKEITENIHHMPIPLLSEMRPGVPEILDEVLAKALERDPAKRQSSGADMLRTLTEASYRSSIVATSIDVADAVAAAEEAGVVGPSVKPQPGMNSIIREQLAGGNLFRPSERRTAVSGNGNTQEASDLGTASTQVQAEVGDGSTIIKSGVDGHGVTIWELDKQTVAAVPSALRKEQESRYQDDAPASPGLRRGVIYSAIAFSSLVAIMIVFVASGSKGKKKNVVIASFDASVQPVEQGEMLTIDSDPQGATVFINGQSLPAPTPVKVRVPAGVEVQTRLVLEGYEELVGTHVLEKGSGMVLKPTLVPLKASLSVNSTPRGAKVFLDGEELGTTPFIRTDLRPGKGRTLQLLLADHKEYSAEIDLVRNETVTIDQTLKSTLIYGDVIIDVGNTWAQVSEGGKEVGNTFKKLHLRVGERQLVLFNPESGKRKTVNITVYADRIETYRFEL